MRRHIIILLLCAAVTAAAARRIRLHFSRTPLPEALIAIDRMSEQHTINFIYDELEDTSP